MYAVVKAFICRRHSHCLAAANHIFSMNYLRLVFIGLILALFSCHSAKIIQAPHAYSYIPVAQDKLPDSELLTYLLKNKQLKTIAHQKDSLRLQIILTQIDRDSANQPHFTHHFYHVSQQYFYPASTVKLPAAIAALEKLNTLQLPRVNKYATMLTDSSYPGQSAVYNDPTARAGRPTIAQYIRKIFLVSDNDAYNRLYEFVGQEALNQRLQALGFTNAQLLHRLSIPLTEDQNRHTNSIRFMDSAGKMLFNQFPAASKMVYQPRTDLLGKGYMVAGSNYYKGDSLVNTPMDFSKKNRLPLTDLHSLLQWVMFPATQAFNNKLNLTDSDYHFLQRYMSLLPNESRFPTYDTPAYYPAYGKFLLLGGQRGAWPDSNLRIFNKIGDAYGFMTDVAYIINKQTGVEFMLSCTLLCNSDGIFNDDKYDYDTIGLPFMKNLGQVIYDYESKRPKQHKPDFSNFAFDYTN